MIEIQPHGQPGDAGHDPDGVRVVPSGKAAGATRLYQGVALLLVSACAGYLLMPSNVSSKPSVDARRVQEEELARQVAAEIEQEEAAEKGLLPAAAAPETLGTPTQPSTRPLTPRRAASKKPGTEPPTNEDPSELPIPSDRLKDATMGEYIQALHDAGIYEGIGAFNPPGTSPPLEGLAVPEDFPIPEGYVRHHQTTDDGQSIEPILMYSPDYEFVDANGNPIQIPADRVVPAEHAPPGLPVRIVQIPQPREPGDTAR